MFHTVVGYQNPREVESNVSGVSRKKKLRQAPVEAVSQYHNTRAWTRRNPPLSTRRERRTPFAQRTYITEGVPSADA